MEASPSLGRYGEHLFERKVGEIDVEEAAGREGRDIDVGVVDGGVGGDVVVLDVGKRFGVGGDAGEGGLDDGQRGARGGAEIRSGGERTRSAPWVHTTKWKK